MITAKDREVLRHVENYDFITAKQCASMFYSDKAYGYDLARKRLNKLVKCDLFKVFKNLSTNENIFHMNMTRRPTYHRILLMNLYAELIRLGCKILTFEKERKWDGGKYRSDGFCSVTLNDIVYFLIVEVNVSHNNINLERYNELYETGEVQKACYGATPRILLIDDVVHKKDMQIEHAEVLQVDYNLKELAKIFQIKK